MAFSSIFSTTTLQFKPLSSSSSRPKPISKKAPKIPTKKPKTQKLKSPKYPPNEATTFTRLPPKDDFDSDNSALESLSEVIKLSDFKPLSTKPQKFDQKVEKNNGFDSINAISEESDDLEDEIDVNGTNVGYDYGRFELYEVGSDDELENEDDIDDEEGLEMFGGEGFEGEIKEKEKGVPAVMRCFDRTKIFVKAGDGGNGVVAFRREKFVPLGGPSGGDGGRGGNVYMEVDRAMNSLLPFRKSLHYRGGRGSHGQGSQKNGAKGDDVVIKVPPGTVVRESGGDVLLELLRPGEKALLLPGGRGGRGNTSFKSGMNKVPKIAENGEEGLEM